MRIFILLSLLFATSLAQTDDGGSDMNDFSLERVLAHPVGGPAYREYMTGMKHVYDAFGQEFPTIKGLEFLNEVAVGPATPAGGAAAPHSMTGLNVRGHLASAAHGGAAAAAHGASAAAHGAAAVAHGGAAAAAHGAAAAAHGGAAAAHAVQDAGHAAGGYLHRITGFAAHEFEAMYEGFRHWLQWFFATFSNAMTIAMQHAGFNRDGAILIPSAGTSIMTDPTSFLEARCGYVPNPPGSQTARSFCSAVAGIGTMVKTQLESALVGGSPMSKKVTAAGFHHIAHGLGSFLEWVFTTVADLTCALVAGTTGLPDPVVQKFFIYLPQIAIPVRLRWHLTGNPVPSELGYTGPGRPAAAGPTLRRSLANQIPDSHPRFAKAEIDPEMQAILADPIAGPAYRKYLGGMHHVYRHFGHHLPIPDSMQMEKEFAVGSLFEQAKSGFTTAMTGIKEWFQWFIATVANGVTWIMNQIGYNRAGNVLIPIAGPGVVKDPTTFMEIWMVYTPQDASKASMTGFCNGAGAWAESFPAKLTEMLAHKAGFDSVAAPIRAIADGLGMGLKWAANTITAIVCGFVHGVTGLEDPKIQKYIIFMPTISKPIKMRWELTGLPGPSPLGYGGPPAVAAADQAPVKVAAIGVTTPAMNFKTMFILAMFTNVILATIVAVLMMKPNSGSEASQSLL